MNETTEWVSLGEAAKVLGVHPATIRNWADRGELPYRRTPGGHRRFRRVDLIQWADSQRAGQPAEAQLIVQSALGRIFTEMDEGQLDAQDWYTKIDLEAREALWVTVRRLMNALIGHLSGTPDGNGGSRSAAEAGGDFAATVRAQGLPLTEAVRGLAFLNRFVIDAVIQLSETWTARSPSEWGDLLRRVYAFNNETVLAIIEYYQNN